MKLSLLSKFYVLTGLFHATGAFSPSSSSILGFSSTSQQQRRKCTSILFKATSTDNVTDEEMKPCFWKSPDGLCRCLDGEFRTVKGNWEQRIQLKDLKIGQVLIGEKIKKADRLNAKTGPKIWFDVGVGRIDSKGNWQMVSGMHRVAKSFAKPSVVKKKVQKLTNKPVELVVHRIFPENGYLEVKLSKEESEKDLENYQQKVSASSLKEGQEVIGKVVDIRPYGCIIDVGANRNGLLHIQRIADLFDKYIDKEKGIEEVGLERSAIIRVSVESNQKKRLFLDFTEETKQLAKEEAIAKEKKKEEETEAREIAEAEAAAAAMAASFGFDEPAKEDSPSDTDDDEAAMWAAYANDYTEDDHYDEDADIEDSLGLGSY